MKMATLLDWIVRIIAAVILLQTLYFKFTAHPESVALFTKLGAEPWGRIGTGIIELLAGILLILPPTAFFGALLGMGLMAGAVLSHLTVIGIESAGDGGQLFILAIIVFLCSTATAWKYREQGVQLLQKLRRKQSE